MSVEDPGFWLAVLQIIWIDVLLSGDNAVVIALACRKLPPRQRMWGIVLGTLVAISLRVIFTGMVTQLMTMPYVKLVGGVLLFWIAVKLLGGEENEKEIEAVDSLWKAIKIVAIADVVMSLDNILAVGGASEGNLMLLIFGLALSIPILLFGSNLVAQILHKYPWLLLIGVLVLVHSAITMIVHDHWIEDLTHFIMPQWEILLATAMVTGIVLAWVRMRHGSIAGLGDDGAIHSPSSSPEAA